MRHFNLIKRSIYSVLLFLILTNSCSTTLVSIAEDAPWADSTLIVKHLTSITKTDKYRNHRNVEQLDKTAAYIDSVFRQYADTTYYQTYEAGGNTYRNIVCRFGFGNDSVIVVGAHYDVCGDQEGADDNASGTVGLLELARMLKDQKLKHPIELVAYTLEEPPHFKEQTMGSYIHAQSLRDANTSVYGMVCLEMIGYFSDDKNSQDYPIGIMKWKYGSVGDYIVVANSSSPGNFSKGFTNTFKQFDFVTTKTITPPTKSMEFDLSDHINYWKFGYDALMITNTAFYRNKNYHKTTDTMETLDIKRMGNVINTVYQTLINM